MTIETAASLLLTMREAGKTPAEAFEKMAQAGLTPKQMKQAIAIAARQVA